MTRKQMQVNPLAQAAKEERRLAKAEAKAAKPGVPKPAPKQREKVSFEALSIPKGEYKKAVDMMAREKRILLTMTNSLLGKPGTRRKDEEFGEAIERVLQVKTVDELYNNGYARLFNAFCKGRTDEYLENTFGITKATRNALVGVAVPKHRVCELQGARRTVATYNDCGVMIPQVELNIHKKNIEGKDYRTEFYCTGFAKYNVKNVIEACGDYDTGMETFVFGSGFRTEEVSTKLMSLTLRGVASDFMPDVFGKDAAGNLYSGKVEKNYIVGTNGNKKMYSLYDGGKHEVFDGKLYFMLNATPSNLRKAQVLLVSCSIEEYMQGYVGHVLRRMTQEAVDLFIDKEFDYPGLYKVNSRLGLAGSPCKEVFDFDNDCGFSAAVYDGKFRHALLKSVEGMDGQGLFSADFISPTFSKFYGSEVSKKETLNLAPQFRLGGTVKGFGVTIPHKDLLTIIQTLNDGKEPVRITSKDTDKLKAYENGEYKGQVVIFGNGPVAVLVDNNNVKTPLNTRTMNTLKVLDIAKPSPARTNVQILQGISLPDGFSDTVREIMYAGVDSKISEFISGKSDITPVDVKNIDSLYAGGTIPQINFDYAKANAPIWKSAVRSLGNSLSKDINRFNFDIEGWFCRLVGDIGLIFGFRTFKHNETYNHMLVPNSETAVYRCPKAGFKDQAVLKVIGYKEVCRRVDASKRLTDEQKRVIKNYYKNLPKGVAALPCTEEIKSLLGGSDYDFDGAIFIANRGFGKKWIVLAKKVGSFPIEIDGTVVNTSDQKYKWSWAVTTTLFYAYLNNKNKAVGQACNFMSLIMSAMTCNDPKTLDVVARNLGLRQGTEDYTPFITKRNQKVSAADLVKFEKWAYSLHLKTDEELLAFFEQFVLIAPAIVGLIIDAAKNSSKVIVPFYDYCMKHGEYKLIHVLKKVGYKFVIKEENGENKVERVLSDIRFDEDGNEYIDDSNSDNPFEVRCILSDLKEEIAEYAKNRLQEVLNLCMISEEEKAQGLKLIAGYSREIDVMSAIRMQYLDIGASLVNAKEEQEKEAAKAVRDELLNTARVLTRNLTLAERGEIARYVSICNPGKNQYSDNKQSGMMNAFVPETIAMLLEKEDSVKICGTPVLLHEDMEDYIGRKAYFKEGIAVCGLTHKAKINGWFLIQKYGNKVYATCPIDEYIRRNDLGNDYDPDHVMIKIEYRFYDKLKGMTIERSGLAVNDHIVLQKRFKDGRHFASISKVDKANGGAGIHAVSTRLTASMYNGTYASAFDNKYLIIESLTDSIVNTMDNKKKPVMYAYCKVVDTLSGDKFRCNFHDGITSYTEKKRVTAAMPTVEEEVARFNSLMSC